jgi:hypothetical protein
MRVLEGKACAAIEASRPHADQLLLCCDLTGCSFRGADLLRTVFFGCDVSGASFSGASLDSCRFVGCFSMPDRPADFAATRATAVSIEASSVSTVGSDVSLFMSRWPAEAERCAQELRAERNDSRYYAVKAAHHNVDIGRLVYPLVGIRLSDTEWEVRQAALEALVHIRKELTTLPYFDAEMVAWLLTRLGDPSPFVRAAMVKLLPDLTPSDDTLRSVIGRTADDPLLAMLASYTLLVADPTHRRLVDIGSVLQTARGAASVEARVTAIGVLERLGENELAEALPSLMTDGASEVRIRALLALGGTSLPDSERYVRTLSLDPDAAVRLQAFETAEEIGALDRRMLAQAQRDPAPEVRDFAARYNLP